MTPKKIAAFAIGPIGGALLSLITLPVITWFFTQEDVGRIAMFQVAISFSVLLFSLGLDQSYVREFHEEKISPLF
ncbi:oligosaccharide flippase family protein [Paenalcaligenes niemegkensis]|uniref:oligosaccharide flippase family protein n=1 Tax=Paenalcaligenes niemegkensis TaxID=2895469 RepID=UPI00356391EB